MDQTDEIYALATFESSLYFGFHSSKGQALPVGVIDTDGGDNSLSNIPIVANPSASVTALYIDENFVYVGGVFKVTLQDGSTTEDSMGTFFFIFSQFICSPALPTSCDL